MFADYDAVVVGAGFAGLTAAAALQDAGRRVALVAGGSGSLVSADACLAATESDDVATRFFTTFAAAAGCRYASTEHDELFVPTLLGELQPAGLAPHFLERLDASVTGLCSVVGIENLSGFDAAFLAERLNHVATSRSMARRYVARTFRLARMLGTLPTVLSIARAFDADRSFRGELAMQLRDAGAGTDALLVPAMLGIESTERRHDAFERAVGLPVRELVTLPPSVAGLRVERLFKQRLHALGVEFFEGFPVRALHFQQRQCVEIEIEAPARPLRLKAGAVVLAAGRHQGSLLPSASVALDEHCHPLDETGAPYAENLVCAPSAADTAALHAANLLRVRAGYRAAQSVLAQEVLHAR